MKFSQIELEQTIQSIPYIQNLSALSFSQEQVSFDITFDFEELDKPIDFNVVIYQAYPLKISDSESIRFYLKNSKYKKFSHVMSDNAICFHNQHCIIFYKKLQQDFQAIKQWIVKYVINQEKDEHYEHLITLNHSYGGAYFSFQFTDIDKSFSQNEIGIVTNTYLTKSKYQDEDMHNYLVQSFTHNITQKNCQWSSFYSSKENDLSGIYVFIGEKPSIYDRFAFSNWQEFKSLFNQAMLSEIWKITLTIQQEYIPIFIGYYIKNQNIHWQVAMIDLKEPFFKNTQGIYELCDKQINWVISKNSSYHYFFGRGAFHPNLTNKKVLIIGLGAMGSQVARTLVRGGCTNITIADYDIKEPENICRSEYNFVPPYTNKTDELAGILWSISPFVELSSIRHLATEYIKFDISSEYLKFLSEQFSEFDYIFDCSTDDDLMYLTGKLNLTSTIFNLSITNHAKALVCGILPNHYHFVRHQFDNILENNTLDLYNPIGCWNPTFKASYNDIAIMAQLSLKTINSMIQENNYQHFVIQYDDNFNLRVERF
ncbi:ThiF family adenylyltransferase [Aggregatibacter actinomycetemcomitans]|uniref:ThiF family adenylyltransferase n=2 Tax=Aggregatibacter actinomycetemcomitans TaxID=714 RepID=UPI0011D91C93|nr:ThiF family adenylyltransferase [Aggregatibacter actinomycetemcomitans]TYA49132.1 thiamine biosynthesis protein ThiF [Aggregatibacter actinomycetemcomitans]